MLKIHLLGKFEATTDGRPVDLPLRAGQALLAYLALNAGAAVRRELLAGLLWPDMAEATAKANLRHTLWRVRKALGPAGTRLAADEAALSLGPANTLWLDARGIGAPAAETSIEALMAVVAAYQGELLPGFYDDWVLLERERLQAAYEAKMARLLERLTAAERWSEVLEWGERWIALGRVPEAAYRALIVAHGARGDASQAAGVYRRCVEALRRELGVSPAAATRAAYEQALQAAGQPPVMSGEPLPALRGYELRERIGAGAYGEVYRAIQPSVERAVAIKVITPAYADRPEFIRRFEAEARLVARLEHPHIVPLYDYWREPGGAYLVMRYLRGGNLREARPAGPWPLERAVQLAEQVGGALQAAHRQGVAHGDVKPENILLDEAGNAYLSDFGIVAGLAGAAGAAALTARHDLYGLGLILRDLLAGAEQPPAVLAVLDQVTHPEPAQRFADVPALLAALRQAADEPRPAGAETELVNPYKGLRPFEGADEADFFGRQALLKRLLGRLAEAGPAARCLAVVGPSGSGKSSAVKAGLLPALRRGALPGSQAWYVAELTPGPHPLRELEQALLRVAHTRPAGLLEQLRRDARGLGRAARQILPEAGAQLLLVIDQFEEAFAPTVDPVEAEHLLASLAAAAVEPDGPVRVLLTLRADFYDRPLRHAAFADVLRARTEVVTPLTPEEIAQAVRGPAERAGAEVEPDLTAALTADVVDQPGALPLLEYALTEVFERRAGRQLTLEAYHALGGTTGALARRAEAVYAALEAEAQTLARQVLLRLVTLGEGVDDTRRRALRSELEALGGGPWAVDSGRSQAPLTDHSPLATILDSFGKARLLTFDRDPVTRTPTVELAHEALLREWPRLRAWLDESRADVRLQRALAQGAAEWAAGGRDDGFLLAGARLAQFEDWMAAATVGLTPAERAYYEASVAARGRREQAEAERQQRELETARQLAAAERARADEQVRALSRVRLRNRLIAAAGGVALVLALVAGFFSVQANQNLGAAQLANTQSAANAAMAQDNAATAEANFTLTKAEQLAAEAVTVIQAGGDPELAALLSLRSLTTQYTLAGDRALVRAAQQPFAQRVFSGHLYAIYAVAFSPDGRYVLTGSRDYTARLWDAQTGQLVRSIRHNNMVTSVAFAPDGRSMLTGCRDRNAYLWDLETGRRQQAFIGHGGYVLAVAFAPDGRQILTGSADETARLWNVQTGEGVQTFRGHTGGITAVAFSPDGRQVLTGGNDALARLWDAETGEGLQTYTGHAYVVTSVAFSPDGRQVLTGGADNQARLVDKLTGQTIHTFTGHRGGSVQIAFSPDGRYIATASDDFTAWLEDALTGRPVQVFAGHTNWLLSVAFSPDSRYVLTGSWDGTARLWETAFDAERPILAGHSGNVASLALAPDGQTLLTGSWDGTARLWDLGTGQTRSVLTPTELLIYGVALAPDGKSAALVGPLDPDVHVINLATGQESLLYSRLVNGATCVAYSPDGRYLLTGNWEGMLMHEVATGRVVHALSLAGHQVRAVAFSPDGHYFLSGGGQDYTARLWDVTTGRNIRFFSGHTGDVQGVAFSPDGQYVATASADKTVRLWGAQGGLVRTFVGHTGGVLGVAFSPDSRLLATASDDMTARLWEVATGRELRRFAGHGAGVNGVAFTPDGQAVITISYDGSGRLWSVDYYATVRYLCGRLSRDLTAEERAHYALAADGPTCPLP